MIKTCKQCGKEFETKSKKQRYCSNECRAVWRKKKNKFYSKNNKTYIYIYRKGIKYTAIIDRSNKDKVLKYYWYLNNTGYAVTDTKPKKTLMHRLIMNCPEDKIIDHIDGNRINNTISNLKICTQKENIQNIHNFKNSSGVYGVYYDKINSKWRASIMVNGKQYRSHRYKDIQEAINWRILMEKKYLYYKEGLKKNGTYKIF